MKQTMIILFIILCAGVLLAQTTINFDDSAKWIQGSAALTSYAVDHQYVDGVFSATGGPALRQTTAVQDGYPGALGTYAWRVNTNVAVNWIITIASGGVSNFSIDIRRWDGTPSPNFTLDYSTDGGSNWSNVATINNTTLDNSSAWKTFNGSINSANSNIKIRIYTTTTSQERIMMDNFVWTGYSGGTPMCATPVIDPAGGYKYSSFNATITCATSGSTIYYTTDGSDPDNADTQYTGPISISSTTTLKAKAYASGYDPSAVATATYTFPVTVANIAALRAGATDGTLYYLSGEAILTFQYTGTGYKHYYIQDSSAAILIYDSAGTITTTYNQYDGITGIYGTLALYNGLLEFIPTLNTSVASSTGNTVTPEVKTLAAITSADQSKLIRINGLTFTSTGTFAAGQNYNISDASKAAGIMRTSFSTADYIGTPIPTTTGDLVCLVGWFNAAQVTPRDLNDFLNFAVVPVLTVTPETLSGFTYVYGNGPSAEQSFTVSGTDLTGDIDITAPTNYEISETSGSGFTSGITLYQAKGDIAPTDIYVRLKAGLAIGTYNDEVINIVSSDATSKTVTCSGTVSTPPPPDAPVVDEPTDIGPDSFTAHWQAVSGATGYYLDVYTLEGGGYATDLFFSEYIEGGSFNKALEIFNGTGSSVDLSNYTVYISFNGGTSTASYELSGTLNNNDVIVLVNAAASQTFLDLADITLSGTSTVVAFNGDDAVYLVNELSKGYSDIIGSIGFDPGSAWTAGTISTVNQTLVRKSSVTGGLTSNPATDFPTLGTEWDSYSQDTATYLGSHTMSGSTMTYVTGYENLNVGNVTSYPVTGLQPNTMYYYVVRAYNDYGTSGDSDEMPLPGDGTVPVELSSFTAVVTSENFVALHWTTQSETNAQGYYIYRNTFNELNSAYRIPALIGATNTSQEANYTFIDEEVLPNNTYYYWLQNLDMDGSFEFHGPINVTILQGDGGDTPPVIPAKTELLAAYPNPFNPVTHLRYSLKTPGFVTIDVYNNRGQLIRSFSNDHPAAGYYQMTWDGKDMNGRSVSSGIYYYRMTSGKYTSSKKVVLLK